MKGIKKAKTLEMKQTKKFLNELQGTKSNFYKVKSLINLPDSRGDIQINQEGTTSSLIPHSNGSFPVWFHKDSHPVFMKPEALKFD